jgi:hypothetical protein
MKDVTQHWGDASTSMVSEFMRLNAGQYQKILLTNDEERGLLSHVEEIQRHGYSSASQKHLRV